MSLRAVLFDFGMVLSTSPVASAHKTLLGISALSTEVFERHYWAHRHAYDEGKFTGEGYWQKVASDAGIGLSAEQIKGLIAADILMWSGINAPMLEWARSVGRAGFKTGILSNIGFELATAMEKNFPWVEEFKYTIWSCRLAMAKPDPKIFHCAQQKLDVAPQEILFIDDREDNIEAARKVGFIGIVFKDVSQLKRDLKEQGFSNILPQL
ncbi:MAG TPA: HAD family phosphatase [Terriglobales bacterium]|nr:HAD family phosphatase [Terriglobales bacterium]